MHILCIGSFPELEAALGEHLAEVKRRQGALAPITVIVPAALLRLHLRRSFAGSLNIRFLTLAELVREHPSRLKPLPPFADELVLSAIVETLVGDGGYFQPVKATAGFRRCMLGTIRDLKEAGIPARKFAELAKSARFNRPKFGQLAALYTAYEKALQQHDVVDETDRLAEAIKAVSASSLPLPTVCLYGFYDFNHLQRQLVRSLASRQSLQVFVPYRDERAYDFAKPTVEWLERLLKVKRTQNPKSEIQNPKCEVVSAPGEARECREILREALAFAGASRRPLHEVAVLARSDEPYGPLLRDLCRARGWPLHLAMGRPPLESVEQRVILLLLELGREDFRRSKVIELAMLAPQTGAAAAGWDQLSAEAGVVCGAGAWRERLRACIHRFQMDQTVHDEARAAAAVRGLAEARELSGFIETLLTVVGRIPPLGRWSELTTTTTAAARVLLPASDALEACVSQLRELDALERFQPTVRREDFAAYVRKAFEAAVAPEGAFQEGGPFVGDIMSARGVSWPMVIVPGLVEKNWPRQLREDPILLDEERSDLNGLFPSEDGLPRLEEKLARGRDEERLLFRLACDAARDRLIITFPRLEPAAGRPRVPSVFLLETLEVANFTRLDRDPRVRVVPLVPMVPPEGELLDTGEYDYRLLEKVRRGNMAGVTPLLDAMSPTLAPGLALEQTRWGSGHKFSGFDGCLQQRESLGLLRKLFDPAQYRWGISRLENYARSPFSFFLSQVLGIQELEEPDDAETISASDFGELYHRLLCNIVERFHMGNLVPLDPTRAVENELVMSDEAEKVFAEFASRGVTGYPLVWRVKQEKTRADLLRWLRFEYANASRGFSPVATEWAFGRAADPPPAQLALDKGMTLLIAGQIDRVDMGPEGEAFILDYKTGKPDRTRNASFCRGRALQIPAYMLATEQLNNKTCGAGAYYFATRRGDFKKRGWTRDELAAAEPRLRQILGCLVRSILAGKFFITPDGADAAGTAFTQAAVEALWESRQSDESIADYRNATAAEESSAKEASDG